MKRSNIQLINFIDDAVSMKEFGLVENIINRTKTRDSMCMNDEDLFILRYAESKLSSC